jgi:predicted nucleotidyltransferase component of viral defense system
MPAFLSLSSEDQKIIIEQSAAIQGWAPSSVEKDFWVCWTLHHLFALPSLTGNLTFKGGTSLSKAYGLIDRFSEDIDLTIGREALGFGGQNSPENAPNSSQRNKRLKGLREACSDFVINTVLPGLDARFHEALPAGRWKLELDATDNDKQTLLFSYPSHFADGAGRYIRPVVKIEFGARSDPWPAENRRIVPLIAQHFPDAVGEENADVLALSPKRTFWEKAMLLHEERFRPSEKARRPRMARHYYDLYRLIQQGVAKEAIDEEGLFNQVAAHRKIFFAMSWVDYDTLRPESLEVLPTEDQAQGWETDYAEMQSEMFSDTPPGFKQILETVGQFQEQFRQASATPPTTLVAMTKPE